MVVGELNGQHIERVKFGASSCGTSTPTRMNCSSSCEGASAWSLGTEPPHSKRGEFLVVPRGVEHHPVTDEEVSVLLFEPATTQNTDDGGAAAFRAFGALERI